MWGDYPKSKEFYEHCRKTGQSTVTLVDEVRHTPRHWPTPTATMYKGWSKNHNRAATDDRLDYSVERESHESNQSGRLNPTWVEWLMGFPSGHTDLKH